MVVSSGTSSRVRPNTVGSPIVSVPPSSAYRRTEPSRCAAAESAETMIRPAHNATHLRAVLEVPPSVRARSTRQLVHISATFLTRDPSPPAQYVVFDVVGAQNRCTYDALRNNPRFTFRYCWPNSTGTRARPAPTRFSNNDPY